MDRLWDLGWAGKRTGIVALPEAIRQCVAEGDGVADHYGGRTTFTFLQQRDDRILVLESLSDGQVQVRTVVNMSGGYGTGILGSANRFLADKLPDMLKTAVTTNDEFHSPERHALVCRVKRMLATHTHTQDGMWDITFTSTGSEAMDLALQLAHIEGYNPVSGSDRRREKDVLVACHGAWHGWLQGPNQLLDRRQFTDGVPRAQGVETRFVLYGDLASLREVFNQYAGRIRAVAVEGLLGDGGVVMASDDWWAELFSLADRENARVINDEILSGFRTGALLAAPKGCAPDCIALGKALGFGLFPLSAVAWRKDKLALRPGIGVRTFNARPFQAAVVDAGLDYIERNMLFERSAQTGGRLLTQLESIKKDVPRVIKAVRGRGLFIGLELNTAFARQGRSVRDTLIRHGVLCEVESGLFNRRVPKEARINETLRLTPPLCMTTETIDAAVVAMRAAFLALDQTLDTAH